MTERLLQFIWQFQYFNICDLETTDGEKLFIIHQGTYNTNQGPDFLQAKIRLGQNTWAGNIELHVNASDWHRHAHTSDKNYANVILHVIWNDDGGRPLHHIPVLSLAGRISGLLLQQYNYLMNCKMRLPCFSSLHLVEEITWISWKERLLVERIEQRYRSVKDFLARNNYHWQETMWWMLARNYGMPVNTDAFEEVARSIPFNILLKHRNNLLQLESLLLGQAGLLDHQQKKYRPDNILLREYEFYAAKYGLKKISLPMHFLRMRPASFPDIRLKQLARLMQQSATLFSLIINTDNIVALKKVFSTTVLINTVLPLIFSYGREHEQEHYMQNAVEWMHRLPSEKNSVTLRFQNQGISNKNAAESQALTGLIKNFCEKKRCLDCAIGNAILKRKL